MNSLRSRARRRSRVRAVGAVASVVVLVAALAVGLSLRGRTATSTTQAFDPSLLPGPTGGVTAQQLTRYHWMTGPTPPIATEDQATVVWTGTDLIIWGGWTDRHYLAAGASFDPSTQRWSALPDSPLSARGSASGAWLNGKVYFWGARTTAAH